MKLKFKIQTYQTKAVESVVNCFAGQMKTSGIEYRTDSHHTQKDSSESNGFKNADLQLTEDQLLKNIQIVQQQQNLPLSDKLVVSAGCKINLDVEMETGTGKTYCYIKTLFEMHKCYGWSKFIVVVPSIAIREGVYKSLKITADHFSESYQRKARFFIYNSKQLHDLESFSSDSGLNIMVINIQAFNAIGKDNRRIYEELDEFQSRRPIDVISRNCPIVILDEPQKMEGSKTLDALSKFKPLMILRYSATHRTTYNKIYRLDALEAYNQKLVKKIAVRGIDVKGLSGTNAYLYLESIEISKKAPLARMELEVRHNNRIKRIVKRFEQGKDLFIESNALESYRGFVISQIDAIHNKVMFTNGQELRAGEAIGDVTEAIIRRIQIRETIRVHLEKESGLFAQGIKTLSLFFIDEVAKYRDYSQPNEQGDYSRIFEQEYEQLKKEYLSELSSDNKYRKYLANIPVRQTHKGYFSIDKKTKKLIDPSFKTRGEQAGISDDVDAYALILKDKERLLSFDEPVRFIFSHSALREGWDNPNVFTLCMLKHSDNTISRRQEVGRGLRLCVNQQGDRMDSETMVHNINILTVIASESYKDFVSNLQRESSSLPNVGDARKPKSNLLNANFYHKEFTEHGNHINPQTFYFVEFDSNELICNSLLALNNELKITPIQYNIQSGEQVGQATYAPLKASQAFQIKDNTTEKYEASIPPRVKYDLIGKLSEKTELTRKTIAKILIGIEPTIFDQFKQNPEEFIVEATRLINEQKANICSKWRLLTSDDSAMDS